MKYLIATLIAATPALANAYSYSDLQQCLNLLGSRTEANGSDFASIPVQSMGHGSGNSVLVINSSGASEVDAVMSNGHLKSVFIATGDTQNVV